MMTQRWWNIQKTGVLYSEIDIRMLSLFHNVDVLDATVPSSGNTILIDFGQTQLFIFSNKAREVGDIYTERVS